MSDEGKARSTAAGAKNLADWRKRNPEGGGVRHGAYSRHIKKRYTDARTTEGRELRATMDALRADLGGISAGQSIILSRVREKIIVLNRMGGYLDKLPVVITNKGELLGFLRSGYVTFSEALRRDIELLYALAGRKLPGRVPDLAGYLNGKRGKA